MNRHFIIDPLTSEYLSKLVLFFFSSPDKEHTFRDIKTHMNDIYPKKKFNDQTIKNLLDYLCNANQIEKKPTSKTKNNYQWSPSEHSTTEIRDALEKKTNILKDPAIPAEHKFFILSPEYVRTALRLFQILLNSVMKTEHSEFMQFSDGVLKMFVQDLRLLPEAQRDEFLASSLNYFEILNHDAFKQTEHNRLAYLKNKDSFLREFLLKNEDVLFSLIFFPHVTVELKEPNPSPDSKVSQQDSKETLI
ncbi:MAG: hypothetical protein KGI28_00415 [Thaumarchaeota archaeon]|nr:hypothetical protein [Nitrososphaerota archaeon]